MARGARPWDFNCNFISSQTTRPKAFKCTSRARIFSEPSAASSSLLPRLHYLLTDSPCFLFSSLPSILKMMNQLDKCEYPKIHSSRAPARSALLENLCFTLRSLNHNRFFSRKTNSTNNHKDKNTRQRNTK